MSGSNASRGPARLLSVRLQGFKSFADRTHVEFGPGVSAIVGPNGSGKSNLADALRWALGEQGRALRTRKSEDVVWAGSEKRPAVGMADVQLTLDNGDGLLPVEYGVVELGRRLYRSGENDYLLNRQRVRLKDLVDLLDAGHLAENAFLFIGQGMVDQALALRPEERRPLFEEVAGVRRHERRRRRAEEQLAESEANIARIDDILAELRPQARRLAQQAEQQANRLTAADELASAILASAHARWHEAGRRAAAAAGAVAESRAASDAAMADVHATEQAIAVAAAALDGQAATEAEARGTLERLRGERTQLQLREGRHASELDAARRERTALEASRAVSATEVATARQALAVPLVDAPTELEAELAALDADIGAMDTGERAVATGMSPSDAAAIRRLEAARAEEQASARRRAADAERQALDERRRATVERERAGRLATARTEAAEARDAAIERERAAAAAREATQAHLADAEATARSSADRLAGARAAGAAAEARYQDARRALDAADGAAFSKAARARGGRSIGDGLVIDPTLQRAVDAALAGIGRAHVLPRGDIAALPADRGVAIAAEAIAGGQDGTSAEAERRIADAARARGGGRLVDAVRRDETGAVTRLLDHVIWLPDGQACLEVQPMLGAGWQAVARDGSMVVGEVATWLRPEGRGLHLQADVARLEAERDSAVALVADASTAKDAADDVLASARAAVVAAREVEASATAARRRAEEAERAAAGQADAAAREVAWLDAQATRLEAEAGRRRAAVEPDPEMSATAAPQAAAAADETATVRLAGLRARRELVAGQLASARAARATSERQRAQAEAAVALAERQLAYAETMAGDLAEREARLAIEREDLTRLLVEANHRVAEAEAALAAAVAAAASVRERLRADEAAAVTLREKARIAQEAGRIAERQELEARLALESLREGLLVELAGLGATGLRQLASAADGAETLHLPPDGEPDPEVLEAALSVAAAAWERTDPPQDSPAPAKLVALRRRFHDLGAVNPFAAEEYAEVRARLDALEAQHTDIQGAIQRTRQLISELDTLVSEQFRRTFAALEKAFDARFQQLFGGGFARLALTDPQDLAATGIEITARPPGKKPQALSMLSGGERALTAVALLFAMLEVRPVPFCVLDEVDAALDEANIGRFTDALRDLSRATQCIVITHNRGTIEVADALYGVTVGDDSVSRVISLRLDEATALADRSRSERARTIPVAVDAASE